MPEETVSIPSARLEARRRGSRSDDVNPGEKRAAFLVLHGFGSNKDSSNVLAPARVLNDLGYVTVRFSMRGCGKSEGEHAPSDLPRAGRGPRQRA